MAVALEFIDFIVPIKTIKEKYPGGWEACLNDHQDLIGGRVWYDDHLFRDGAMSPGNIKAVCDRWASMGFELFSIIDGKQHWKEVCITEGMRGGVTCPCDWIEFITENHTHVAAYMKGHLPGKIIGRVKNSY